MLFACTLLTLASGALAVRILGDLLETTTSEGHVDLFIQFAPYNYSKLQLMGFSQQQSPYFGLQEFAHEERPYLGRASKRQVVYEVLNEYAERIQGPILKNLRELGYDARSFWINNSIFVKKASAHLVTMMINFAHTSQGSDIVSLSPNRIVATIPPFNSMRANVFNAQLHARIHDIPIDQQIPWNLKLIKAHRVWPKTKGEGVVVANIDTGVDYSHPQLISSYRGVNKGLESITHEYNWFDPTGRISLPHDLHGHGTHTIGIIVGKDVGIAPEAKWIAAQGCDREQCSQERLLASAQWVMCPTDLSGAHPKCELGADIINNSWGGAITDEESMTWFSAAVNAWLAAEMIPIFAQGNSGPACATAGTPGDLESVIAVGAVDEIGSLTIFSSRGPGGSGLGHARFKPDYVAPGQGIISCKVGGGLVAMSGTSMAAPHVAAVAALLLSLRLKLTFDDIRTLITMSVNTDVLQEPQMGQQACYGVRWDHFPNYQYGYGLVDVEAAMNQLLYQKR